MKWAHPVFAAALDAVYKAALAATITRIDAVRLAASRLQLASPRQPAPRSAWPPTIKHRRARPWPSWTAPAWTRTEGRDTPSADAARSMAPRCRRRRAKVDQMLDDMDGTTAPTTWTRTPTHEHQPEPTDHDAGHHPDRRLPAAPACPLQQPPRPADRRIARPACANSDKCARLSPGAATSSPATA